MRRSESEKRRDALEKLKYAAEGPGDIGIDDIDSSSFGSKLSSEGAISNAQAWAHTVAKAKIGYSPKHKVVEDGSYEMIVSIDTPSTASMSSGVRENRTVTVGREPAPKDRVCCSDTCCCGGFTNSSNKLRTKRNVIIPRPINLQFADNQQMAQNHQLPSTNRVRHFSQNHRDRTPTKHYQPSSKERHDDDDDDDYYFNSGSVRKVNIADKYYHTSAAHHLDSTSDHHCDAMMTHRSRGQPAFQSATNERSFARRQTSEESQGLLDATSLQDEGGRDTMIYDGGRDEKVIIHRTLQDSMDSQDMLTADYVRDTMIRESSDERQVPILPRLASWAIKIAKAGDSDEGRPATQPAALRTSSKNQQDSEKVSAGPHGALMVTTSASNSKTSTIGQTSPPNSLLTPNVLTFPQSRPPAATDAPAKRVVIPDLKLAHVEPQWDDYDDSVQAPQPPVQLRLFSRSGRSTNVVGDTRSKNKRYPDLSPGTGTNLRLRHALGTFRMGQLASSRSPLSCPRRIDLLSMPLSAHYPMTHGNRNRDAMIDLQKDANTPQKMPPTRPYPEQEILEPLQRLDNFQSRNTGNPQKPRLLAEAPANSERAGQRAESVQYLPVTQLNDAVVSPRKTAPNPAEFGQLDQTTDSGTDVDRSRGGPVKTEAQRPAEKVREPQPTQPQFTQPQFTQPQFTQPQFTQPQCTQPQFTQPRPRRNSVEQYRDEMNSLSSLGPEWSNSTSNSSEENHVIHAANFLSSITSECNVPQAPTITSSIMSSIEDEHPTFYPVPSGSPKVHRNLLVSIEKSGGHILDKLEEANEQPPQQSPDSTLLFLSRVGNRRLKNAASNRVRVAEMRFEKGVPCNALALTGNEMASLKLMGGFVVSFDTENGDILVSRKKQQKRYRFDDMRMVDGSDTCLQAMRIKFPHLRVPDDSGMIERPELQRNSLCAYFESRSFPFIFIFETVDDKSDFIELLALNTKKYLTPDVSDRIRTILPESFLSGDS